MRLSTSNLRQLRRVDSPTYDRDELRAGILHIGVGNFHRSHMAAYLDDLHHKDFKNSKDWGIVGAGIMSFDTHKRNLLEPQDWLQTLVQQDGESVKARILGSMIDFLPAEAAAILDAISDTEIKIVSLTVTEGGYFLNDGKFSADHPYIQHDVQHPNEPQTVFGIIVKALQQRKESCRKPFTVMSCDNIPHNGEVVKSVVLGLAAQIDQDLAKWIEDNVAFPNSMVDRITTATTDDQRKFIKENFGYDDASPVCCEPFRQWVLEDNFSDGRPMLELCDNVKFVSDVAPFEFMKIRILNGGHAALCYPGALLGIQYVHEAMQHPTIEAFLDALERNEIIPTVPPVPDTLLDNYWKIIGTRFSNPTLNDTLERICFDGASRQPKFIVPVAKDNLEAGRTVDGIALVSALWCRYCQGTTEAGETIAPNDPEWDRLQQTALKAKEDPKCWIAMTDVYGAVGVDPVFVESFSRALRCIQWDGVEAAMKKYIEASV